jgi:signal recognition particle subunit SRP72
MSLESLLQSEDHEAIIKWCNTSKDSDHIKVVALLKLNRFDDAIRLCERSNLTGLEYAYALYKSGQLERAEKVARGIDSRGGKQLLAQILYKLERFGETAKLYQELDPKDEDIEIRINLNATLAQLRWKKEQVELRDEEHEAFETAYNAACYHIAHGELEKALRLLGKARG